jgi:hypothetical protein
MKVIKIERVDHKMNISTARDLHTGRVVDLHGALSVYETDFETLMSEVANERGLGGTSRPTRSKKMIKKSFSKLYPGMLTPFALNNGQEVVCITTCWLSDEKNDNSCIFIGGNRGVHPDLMGLKYELVTPEIWYMEISDARVQGVIS